MTDAPTGGPAALGPERGGPGTTVPSLPALGGSGPRVPRPRPPEPPYAADEAAAVVVEMHTAVRVAEAVAGLTGVLLLLTLLRAIGPLPLGAVPASDGGASPWPRSMLAIITLAVATQFVALLIVAEHRVGPVFAPEPDPEAARAAQVADEDTARPASEARGRQWVHGTRAPAAIWIFRGVLLVLVVFAVATEWIHVTWASSFGTGALLEVLALIIVVAAHRRLPPRPAPHEGRTGPGPSPEPASALGRTDPAWSGDAAPAGAEDRLLAVGASGGGIRAAAFVLGGTQALQSAATDLGAGDPEHEPQVFAVSGGSYIAAAMALARRFGPTGDLKAVTPWTTSYTPESPELERLRRHTRYLFEPGWRFRDGAVSLVLGAFLNVLVVGIGFLYLAWGSVLIAVTFGAVVLVRDGESVIGLRVAPDWTAPQWFGLLLPVILCLVAIGSLTVAGWRQAAVFDGADPGPEQRRHAQRTMNLVQRLRAPLLIGTLGWLLVGFGLPAGAAGVVSLTTHNQPTAMVAGALHALGFGTQDMCRTAFTESVRTAATQAGGVAGLNPDTAEVVTAGACGFETTVTRTFTTQGDVNPANDALTGTEGIDLGWQPNWAVQLGSIWALLGAVVGLLRRGPTPEGVAEDGRWARAKRVLLTWLPLTVAGVVTAYLLLLWSFHYLIELRWVGTSSFVAWSAGLAVLACVVSFLVDANATSLHGFYRARLADAFCVGADATRAEELPPERVYAYSALSGIRLNIVATLNSLHPNQAPTMRGGFPFVFSARGIEVFREEGRTVHASMRRYERYAGPGRTSVMASVAVSGAAISPLMGRFGIQMAPYRALLTLLNLRVGTWVRNPAHARQVTPPVGRAAPALPTSRNDPAPRGWLWVTSKPGLAQMALEAVGRLSADSRWIYLSDGGHLDNTGLVECVRHCIKAASARGERPGGRVVILDASNDPPGTWSAVGDAIAVIRADLNIDLQRRPLAPAGQGPSSDAIAPGPPWARLYGSGGLEVLVVKAVRVEPPAADAPGTPTDWTAPLPPNVQSFQLVNKDFPRASTARQKFGDLEFEAYRGLGYAATHAALSSVGWVSATP